MTTPSLSDCRPYADCSVCKQFKHIEADGWEQYQVDDRRRKNSPLLCIACAQSSSALGLTDRDTEMYECQGCRTKQGRTKYSVNDLKNRLKPGRDRPLFSLTCVQREKQLLDALRRKEAVRCNKKCFGPGHVDNCKAHPYYSGYNVGVQRCDIGFLKIRNKHIY